MIRRWRCGAVGLCVGLLIGACGSRQPATATVNPTRVAVAIKAAVTRQRHVVATVTCPTGVRLNKGTDFYCVAQTGSHITPFQVQQTDSSGHVTFAGVAAREVPELNTVVVARAIVSSIKHSRGITAAVRCPRGIPRQAGLSFACTATYDGDRTAVFEVSQLNASGRVSYRAL